MPEMKTFLKELISLPGLSGYEDPVRDVIAEAWKPLVDELATSRVGSLHGIKRGSGDEPRPKILLAAHMDAIGLMVTGISLNGLLRITRVGGVDPRILPGTPVIVHGREDLPAVVAQPPDSLLPASLKGKPVRLEYLLVDTGLEAEDVRGQVRVGDLVSFATDPIDLTGDTVAGHSLDNRASVAALTVCLEELRGTQHSWDVYTVATVQEETALLGGFTSPFEIQPQLAVAIDVTFAKGPGASDYRAHPLGKGITLDWGPDTHPILFDSFRKLAERLDMPFAVAVYPAYSGTDAMGISVVGEGIPTMVVSIPLRYMHTPVEVVSFKDVARAGRLLAEFIAGLAPDFLDTLRWDEEKANE